MKRIFVFILLLGACNNPTTPTTASTSDTSNQTVNYATAAGEKLLGFRLDSDSQFVVITVISNGCTVKNDFRFTMQQDALLIERTRRDDCKRMPFATELRFSFKEAGIDGKKPFKVVNSFNTAWLN